MKIRADFVTNSSSTSFVLIAKGELTRELFHDLIGVKKDSPLISLFDGLYDVIERKSKQVADHNFDPHWSYTNELKTRINEAIDKSYSVYIGMMDSDSDAIESFFCTDGFEAENENIYFNAMNCYW